MHSLLAKLAWIIVVCAFDIKTSFNSVSDIISWVFCFPVGMGSVIAVIVGVVVWALWKTRWVIINIFHLLKI